MIYKINWCKGVFLNNVRALVFLMWMFVLGLLGLLNLLSFGTKLLKVCELYVNVLSFMKLYVHVVVI